MAETSQQATMMDSGPVRPPVLGGGRQAVPARQGDAVASPVPCSAAHGRTCLRAIALRRAKAWPRASTAEKAAQGILAAVMAASLATGLLLTASPTGTGTHTVLGLPPCGMLVVTGRPCPTCGVTTSFVLAAHGRFYEAMVNQPFGLAVFFLAAGGLISSVWALVTGRSWLPLLTVSRNRVLVLGLILTALGLVSWAYKWSTM